MDPKTPNAHFGHFKASEMAKPSVTQQDKHYLCLPVCPVEASKTTEAPGDDPWQAFLPLIPAAGDRGNSGPRHELSWPCSHHLPRAPRTTKLGSHKSSSWVFPNPKAFQSFPAAHHHHCKDCFSSAPVEAVLEAQGISVPWLPGRWTLRSGTCCAGAQEALPAIRVPFPKASEETDFPRPCECKRRFRASFLSASISRRAEPGLSDGLDGAGTGGSLPAAVPRPLPFSAEVHGLLATTRCPVRHAQTRRAAVLPAIQDV